MLWNRYLTIAVGCAAVAVLELVALVNDFFQNQYQQAWFESNYPLIYWIMFHPISLAFIPAGFAIVFGISYAIPAHRLETTVGDGAQIGDFPAPRTSGEGVVTETFPTPRGGPTIDPGPQGVVKAVAATPAATTPRSLTLSEKIRERIAAVKNAQPATPNGGEIAVSKNQLETLSAKPLSKLETFMVKRKQEFNVEQQGPTKLGFRLQTVKGLPIKPTVTEDPIDTK